MSSLTVAVAQIECRPADIAFNLALHEAAIDEARAAGAGLLVFPELSLTDYLAAPDCDWLALTRDAPIFMSLADRAGPMAVSAGFIERSPDGRFFNAQALLSQGRLLDVHRKINLPGYGNLREDKVYSAGDAIKPVHLDGEWLATTLICADTWNPALPWIAALREANVAIVPAASARTAVGDGFDNPRGWTINLEHTALTYGLPVAFANHCGRRDATDFWGGSRILDSDAREIARAGSSPALIYAKIDLAAGAASRRRLPTIADSNPALVRQLLETPATPKG
jgi:predicted amidohydrolase